jgi:hypothetical protein
VFLIYRTEQYEQFLAVEEEAGEVELKEEEVGEEEEGWPAASDTTRYAEEAAQKRTQAFYLLMHSFIQGKRNNFAL